MLAVRSNISRGNRTLRQKAQGNHNLEEQAQALYKSWFVDFEPFRGGRFVDSELGLIPEGWSVQKAEESHSRQIDHGYCRLSGNRKEDAGNGREQNSWHCGI